MHFGGERLMGMFRGDLQPIRVALQKRRRTGQRCADYGQPRLRQFSFLKISRLTFAAQTSAAKSQIKAALICFPEIGGTKNRGNGLNGTCKSRMKFYAAAIRAARDGRWMVFTISHFRRS